MGVRFTRRGGMVGPGAPRGYGGIMALLLGALPAAGADLAPVAPHAAWPARSVDGPCPAEISVSLTPVWHIDCGADSEPVIGRLVAAASGLDGEVLLVDSQLARVLVVNGRGEIVRCVGTKGEGPGELTGAFRAVRLRDGRFAIADGAEQPTAKVGRRGSVVLLDDRLQPAGELLVGGDPGKLPVCTLRELRYAGDEILAVTYRYQVVPPLVTSVLELSRVDPSNAQREVYARRVYSTEFGEAVTKEAEAFEPYSGGRCDISRTGDIAFATDRDEWSVAIGLADGGGVWLKREWPRVKRSEAELDDVYNDYGGSEGVELVPWKPVIRSLGWRPSGTLWVEAEGTPASDGAVACYDEFSATGEWLARISVSIPGTTDNPRLELLADGRIIVLEGFGRHAGGTKRDLTPRVTLYELAR